MLEATTRHPIHFDYVHQISGQNYLLRSNEQFDIFFEKTDKSFMCFNYEDEMDHWKPIYDDHANWWSSNGTNGFLDTFFRNHHHSRLFHKIFPRTPIKNYAGGWDWFS